MIYSFDQRLNTKLLIPTKEYKSNKALQIIVIFLYTQVSHISNRLLPLYKRCRFHDNLIFVI